tara:strand:- start:4427 stop:5779 length:1353 start_codon:yes stop_codon:yes gene_type:complete
MDLLNLTRELCTYPTGIVSHGNKAFFERVSQEIPIHLHRYASGSTHNGWEVPKQWQVEKATIHRDGELIYDGTQHPLGVAHYSRSFQGQVKLADLHQHVFSNPTLPDAYMWHCAWLYRPWESNWGFSMPHRVALDLRPGTYEVDLVTNFRDGEMLLAEHEHKGRSSRTIVFHSNSCHPHMANDGFAGTAVMIRLFQWLANQETHYTYRLVIGPEHVGTIFYLRDHSKEEVQRLQCGIFAEMMGTPGPFKIARSFNGDHAIDQIVCHVASHYADNPQVIPFAQGVVNDETVWESPGYEVPFVALNRAVDSNSPFPQYHSSLDTADLMQVELLEEFYDIFTKVIYTLENNCSISRHFNGLIALSNPNHDLYISHIDPAVQDDQRQPSTDRWSHLQDCIMRYFDGKMSVLDIAEKHNLPFKDVLDYLKKYEEKGLVTLHHLPIDRKPPKLVCT